MISTVSALSKAYDDSMQKEYQTIRKACVRTKIYQDLGGEPHRRLSDRWLVK